MIQVDKEKYNCCGCGGCTQVCPRNCIEMKTDNEGFLYPEVDKSLCVDCHMCEQICPMNLSDGPMEDNTDSIIAYGGWHKNKKVRFSSSSGGAFALIAEYILTIGGKVYGCTLDSDMKAIHIGISKKEDLYKLQGSKYVQSEIGTVYSEIKECLKKGQPVLFVGTPCQAAGLYTYLGKKQNENLYIVDFICHGVPSPLVFHAYIKKLEKKYRSKVVSYKFRNKDRGWNQTGLQLGSRIEFSNGKVIRKFPAFQDSFMNGFLDDLYLRPSCYECKFKSLPKTYADFTIADFWGVNHVSKTLNDGKGTSLILIHTKHGNEVWNYICSKAYFEPVHFEPAIQHNRSLLYSVRKNKKREDFFKDFTSNGYAYVERKYLSALTWIMHKSIQIIATRLHR